MSLDINQLKGNPASIGLSFGSRPEEAGPCYWLLGNTRPVVCQDRPL